MYILYLIKFYIIFTYKILFFNDIKIYNCKQKLNIIKNINYKINKLSLNEKLILAEYNFKINNLNKSMYFYSLIVKYHSDSNKFIESLEKIGKILFIKKDFKKSIFIYEQLLIVNYENHNSNKYIKIIEKIKNLSKNK